MTPESLKKLAAEVEAMLPEGWATEDKEGNVLWMEIGDEEGHWHAYPDSTTTALGIVRSLHGLAPGLVPEPEADAYLDIVFDGPPSHEAPRFVEVENEQGCSVRAGEWVEREDGYWVLRIQVAPTPEPPSQPEAEAPEPEFRSHEPQEDVITMTIAELKAEHEGAVDRYLRDHPDPYLPLLRAIVAELRGIRRLYTTKTFPGVTSGRGFENDLDAADRRSAEALGEVGEEHPFEVRGVREILLGQPGKSLGETENDD